MSHASTLYRHHCAQLPDHTMHIYARMVVTLYLVSRYGHRVQSHRQRLAVALERMEPTQ